jgi:hypothetical protein
LSRRFDCCERRRFFAGALALTAVAIDRPARAGDRLDISQLVEQSQGAVVLEVRRGRGKAPDSLRILQVVAGPLDAAMPVPPDWNDRCIPSRKELTRWVVKHKSWKDRPLWQKALAARQFEALVFFAPYEGRLMPFCELERMLLKHISLHPHYSSYVADVRAEWAKRPTAPPPKP